MSGVNRTGHIRLTSHPEPGEVRFPIHWGDADPAKRAGRLALLARLTAAVGRIADFSKIEG